MVTVPGAAVPVDPPEVTVTLPKSVYSDPVPAISPCVKVCAKEKDPDPVCVPVIVPGVATPVAA